MLLENKIRVITDAPKPENRYRFTHVLNLILLIFSKLKRLPHHHGWPYRRYESVRYAVRIFGPRFYMVRYVVRIWSEILYGTVRGTDLVRNFIWYGTWY